MSRLTVPGSGSGSGDTILVQGQCSRMLLVGASDPVTANMGAGTDTNDATQTVLLADDTTAEAFKTDQFFVPSTATTIDVTLLWRPETAPGAAANMGANLYGQNQTSNGTPSAWGAAHALTTQAVSTNENDWSTATTGITMAQAGLAAGKWGRLVIARNPGVASDVTGDLAFKSILVTAG